MTVSWPVNPMRQPRRKSARPRWCFDGTNRERIAANRLKIRPARQPNSSRCHGTFSSFSSSRIGTGSPTFTVMLRGVGERGAESASAVATYWIVEASLDVSAKRGAFVMVTISGARGGSDVVKVSVDSGAEPSVA